MLVQAANAERAVSKLRALTNRKALVRATPDLEALTEAEGIAMRPGPRPKIDAEVVGALRSAILASRKVRLHYKYRGSGRLGYDTLHPYGFIYGNRHYLVAWSENQKARDLRNFALSNVQRVEMLNCSFARHRSFSLKAYAERSFGVYQEKPFDVVCQFSAAVAVDAKEFLFHPSQVVEEQPDGSVTVRFRAGGLQEIAWHLFTWGKEVTVMAPRRLRELLPKQCTAYTRAVPDYLDGSGRRPARYERGRIAAVRAAI